ncbi:hypothetical protein QP157_20905 [Sphingomonas sp. LR61]|uniref:hypothetical protein n=1 Tax=Sphingomonas sp. LR61 TaxID=3050234 RepID=UPI002FE3C3AD
MNKLDDFAGKFKDNLNWWNIPKVGTTIKNDWATISKQFGADRFTRQGFTSWAERIGGVDFQLLRNDPRQIRRRQRLGTLVGNAPKWHTYVNGGMAVWGKNYSIAGLVINPIGDGADKKRPWTDDWNAIKHPIAV